MGIVTWGKRALNLLTASNTWSGTNTFQTATLAQQTTSNAAKITFGWVTEQLTLSTGAATTDTSMDLPANSIIDSVVYRVTTTITTAASYSIGDPTTAARFISGSTGLTAGSTGVGLLHMQGGITTDAAGPVQITTAKVRVTCNTTPGAGVIRLTVFYRTLTPPTS